MNAKEIIKILGIEKNDSKLSISKKYKELARRYHPDLAGPAGEEVMKAVNLAYDDISDIDKFEEVMWLCQGDSAFNSETDELLGDKLLRVYEKLSKLPINIELIGTWFWLTGERTKAYKEDIKTVAKEAGCGYGFSKAKVAWYIKPHKIWRKGKDKSMKEIRSMWGTKMMKEEENQQQVR